jgi:cytidine deaminase
MAVSKKQLRDLIELAREAAENAYAPYSGYRVGAVVFTESENAYLGSNIENASYGLTVCAERVAIWKAVSERDDEFQAVVIAIEDDKIPRPCGACLQVMAEFERIDKPMQLVLVAGDGRYEIHRLGDYLPRPFQLGGSKE